MFPSRTFSGLAQANCGRFLWSLYAYRRLPEVLYFLLCNLSSSTKQKCAGDRNVFVCLLVCLKLVKCVGRGIVGTADEQSLLETILLRDCIRLKEVNMETCYRGRTVNFCFVML